MTWVKVDDGFRHHPKAIRIGPLGRDLFVCGLGYCAENLTDGFIPDDMVPHLAPGQSHPTKIVARLLLAGLWTREEEGGYHVHDYLAYNPSREQVLQDRQYQALKRDMYADGALLKVIRARDQDRCRYCGALVNWRDRRGPRSATYDHIVPAGGNAADNLVVACRGCNAAKRDRTPEQAGMVLHAPGWYQVGSSSDLDRIQNESSPRPDPTRPDPIDSETTPFVPPSGPRPDIPAKLLERVPALDTWPSPDALMALWNDIAARDGLLRVRSASAGRRDKATKYLRQFPDLSFWLGAFSRIKASALLRGETKNPGHESFRADFDWLLTKGKDGTENIVKVHDGKYDDRETR